MNATKQPTPNNISSAAWKTKPTSSMYFNSFNSDAPTITGIAKKNVNSAATLLSSPKIKPPIIVEPLLLVPGIKDNNWKPPTPNACLYVISFNFLVDLFPRFLDSNTINAIPYTIKAIDTTTLLYRCSSNQSSNSIPITAAGRQATKIFPYKFSVFFVSSFVLPNPHGNIVLKYIITTANIAPN